MTDIIDRHRNGASVTDAFTAPAPRGGYVHEAVGFVSGLSPRTCDDQPEVQAANAWVRERIRVAGGHVVQTAAASEFNARAVAEMKSYRFKAIEQQLLRVLEAAPFRGLVVLQDGKLLHGRAKEAGSIADKMARRFAAHVHAAAEPPNHVMYDVYAFRFVVRNGLSEAQLWNMLQYIADEFNAPSQALDGGPTLRTSAPNPHSAVGYRDQRALLETEAGGARVPFELQAFTEDGYAMYQATHADYRRARKEG